MVRSRPTPARRNPVRYLMIAWLVALSLIPAVPARSQERGTADAQREAMAKLGHWIGEWEGKGWAAAGPGARQEFTIHESVSSRLGGLLFLVQGRGTTTDPETGEEHVTHDALAVLSYDPAAEAYVFRHYTSRGDYGEDPFLVTEEGYEWGFSRPEQGVHMKFTIQIEGDAWHETGQFSRDGSQWFPSMEMTLRRVEE